MTKVQERDLRAAFEACMDLLSKTGDTLARVETLQDPVPGRPALTYRCLRGCDTRVEASAKTRKAHVEMHARQHTDTSLDR